MGNSAAAIAFRIPNNLASVGIAAPATWVEFVDPDTSMIRTPVVDDNFQRYYFASPSQQPTYNTTTRIQAGQPAWLLGVPAPGCAPVLDVTGGGATQIIGNDTSDGTQPNDTPGGNTIALIKITTTGNGTLNDVSIMPKQTLSLCQFKGVLYTDNGGVPGTLIDHGVVVHNCVSGVAIVSAFNIPPALIVNTSYWIGIMSDHSITYAVADATKAGFKSTSTYSNGPPSSIAGGTSNNPTWQMWADLATGPVLESRAYVYTWVTAYDEEGPPSPPTLVDAWSNSVYKISLWTPVLTDMGVNRDITHTNIYRTISGTGGQTTYFLVATVPVTQASYTDTVDDSIIALNSQLLSTFWTPPPVDLQGMVSMPNGMIVGWRANEIWFCEPYRPHAWPTPYILSTTYPIVGIGVVGQTAIICTNDKPEAATGVSPATMSQVKGVISEPCLTRGSIVNTNAGVYYISPNGLILVDTSGTAQNTTEQWITRERWNKFTPGKNIRAIRLASAYYGFGTVNGTDISVAQEGFAVEINGADGQSFSIWPQPGGHRIGFSQLSAPNTFDVNNLMIDPWTGFGLIVQNQAVYYYDFTDQAPAITPYLWRSKKFQQTSRHNFEAARVWFDIPPNTPAQTPTRNISSPQSPLPAGEYGVLRVYADDSLVMTRELRTSYELLRLPSGFKAETWQFEIEAVVAVTNIQVATSVKELRNV